MAVLARVNWVAQQRVDLNHILAQESFLAYDFRSLLTAFSGLDQPYALRGFEVVAKTSLTISVRVQKSLVFNPFDGVGSFYAGGDDDDDILVDLPADQENIFVEAKFTNETQAPVNTAFWDSLALTGDDVAGTEFTASTNTQNVVVLTIEANTVGFSADAVPILRASTSASAVTGMIDSRNMLFRLGTGGPTPDPLHKFPWSNTRNESIAEGTGVGNDSDSPFRSSDVSGIRNDKGIRSLKEWMDAVMTRISEIAGQAIWYDNSLASAAVSGLTLNTLFFDTIGHSIQPDSNVTFKWTQNGGGDLVLTSQGQDSVKWQSNYTELQWELGGEFVNNTPGGSRAYSEVKFESPSPVENGNLYLLLEREVAKGSGNSVTWSSNSADTNLVETRSISGVSGDFAGIAIGDYIRKESEGFLRYYRVARLSDGTTISSTADLVADNTIVAVEVDKDIVGTSSTEPLRYYRSKYSNDDLVADSVVGEYNNQDTVFYWLGRRREDIFLLKGFGSMQEGEEVTVLNDEFIGNEGAGVQELILEHGFGSIFNLAGTYTQSGDGVGNLLNIRKRKRDNTVDSTAPGDNTDASLLYTIQAPVTGFSVGDSLWVKLDDSGGGILSSGSVAGNTTDDEDNTETTTNVYEVVSAADLPLRNFDNRDVHLIARCVTLQGPEATSVLMFVDGTVISQEGTYINNRFFVSGRTRFYDDDIHLMTRSGTAILYIDQGETGRIDEDVANFFYDEAGQIQGTFNYRWGVNTLTLATPDDVAWLSNLGAHTLALGGSDSTIRVLGDLEVLGTTVSAQVATIQSDDKLITLGVGNLASASGGSGFEVADNTQEVDEADSTDTQAYIDLTFAAPHGYVSGMDVGISSNTDVGGITSGQITGNYNVVGSATLAGQAEVTSATTLRIITNGTATSTANVPMTPPSVSIRTFDVLTWMKVTDADGATSGMTSWGFKVKGLDQVVTVTPQTDYGTLPTAHSASMTALRIPFVGNDNAGPGGADSTFDFTEDFRWDDSAKELQLNGDVMPQTDNTYVVGTQALRWAEGHFGDAGLVVHNDATNTEYIRMRFNAGVGTIDTNSALTMQLRANQIQLTTGGSLVATVRSTRAFNFEPIAEPGSAIIGDFHYDSTLRKLKHYDGIDWQQVDNGDISGEITGFEDRNDSEIDFTNGTRTFTIQPTGSFFDYYIQGTRYRISGTEDVVLPNITGLYFIYFDNTETLQQTTAFSPAILTDNAYVATVYWNAVTGEAEFLSEERHGLTMDGESHIYLHLTQGTKYVSGLTLSANAALNGDGSTDDQAQFEITGGTIRDEDISIVITDAAVPSAPFEQILSGIAQIPVAYRIGADGDWQRDTATDFPVTAGVARPRWNEFTGGAWQLTDVSVDEYYFVQWIFATNDINEPVIAIMGQDEYVDLSTAQSEAQYETLQFGDLPFQEFKLLFRVIFRADSNYANSIKATAEDIVDYRRAVDTTLSSSYMPSDHGNLSGLGDDDHTIYAFLAGRAGGQILYGGQNSGDNLILRSTQDATKGQVYVPESTTSTSPATGALRVTGGMGVGENINAQGNIDSIGYLRTQSSLRLSGQQNVTANTVLSTGSMIVLVDTSASGTDITIDLPLTTATVAGQYLVIKDVGGQLSLLGKRAFIRPQSPDILITDETHTNAAPFLWDIDHSSLTLWSDGAGRWLLI